MEKAGWQYNKDLKPLKLSQYHLDELKHMDKDGRYADYYQ